MSVMVLQDWVLIKQVVNICFHRLLSRDPSLQTYHQWEHLSQLSQQPPVHTHSIRFDLIAYWPTRDNGWTLWLHKYMWKQTVPYFRTAVSQHSDTWQTSTSNHCSSFCTAGGEKSRAIKISSITERARMTNELRSLRVTSLKQWRSQ